MHPLIVVIIVTSRFAASAVMLIGTFVRSDSGTGPIMIALASLLLKSRFNIRNLSQFNF